MPLSNLNDKKDLIYLGKLVNNFKDDLFAFSPSENFYDFLFEQEKIFFVAQEKIRYSKLFVKSQGKKIKIVEKELQEEFSQDKNIGLALLKKDYISKLFEKGIFYYIGMTAFFEEKKIGIVEDYCQKFMQNTFLIKLLNNEKKRNNSVLIPDDKHFVDKIEKDKIYFNSNVLELLNL